MAATGRGALSGIRVLDFTQMMLGPFATQLLGDLGADVVKIERPDSGEWERGLTMGGQLVAGDSAAFLAMNRNKRSVAIDLKAPGAREALLRLGERCDVVVENFRPGVLDRLGLGYDDFAAVRPDIVYCSGTGWGRDTRYARENRPGQDMLVQAMSGLAHNTGRAGDPPTIAGTSVSDCMTAMTLANGILAALLARERFGVGQRVEVDLFATTIAAQCQEIAAMVSQGQEFPRSEAGIPQPWLGAPCGIYRARDGWFAVAMADLGVVGEVFGEESVAGLDSWADREQVKRRLDEVTPSRDAEAWVADLLAAGVWAARVRSMREAVDELVADGSELIVTTDHPRAGPLTLVGCPVTLSETPWRLVRPPPLVGEHTAEVLGEVLSGAELDALRATKAIR